jgi:hypothetical protein
MQNFHHNFAFSHRPQIVPAAGGAGGRDDCDAAGDRDDADGDENVTWLLEHIFEQV